MKRFFSALVLVLITLGLLAAANPVPRPTITLVQGLPEAMNVGDVRTVIVEVTSAQEFTLVQALPSFAYPGKGVVAIQGGDQAVRGTHARIEIPFQAKSSTARMQGGAATVDVVVGVRYPGGTLSVQEYSFTVMVP